MTQEVKHMEAIGCAFQPRGASLAGMAEGNLSEILLKLRSDRGWTQATVAERADIAQTVVSRLERGEMKNPTARILAGLAGAFEVPINTLLGAAQEGRDDDSEWSRAPRGIRNAAAHRLAEPAGPTYGRSPDEEEPPLESALFVVMDSKKYRAADFDAARRTVHETHRYLTGNADLNELARNILDAASVLRREGKPVNTASIMARVVSGPVLGTETPRPTVDRAADPAVDASLRAKGLEPGQGAEAFKARMDRINKKKKPAED